MFGDLMSIEFIDVYGPTDIQLQDIYVYMSDDLNLGWLIHYASGHRMPKPCKAMGNLKSDTPLIHHMILWIVYNMNLFIQQLLMDWRWRRRVVSTCERHPLSPKAPKVEKAMGNLKYWMGLIRVNRGFDSRSYIYIHTHMYWNCNCIYTCLYI